MLPPSERFHRCRAYLLQKCTAWDTCDGGWPEYIARAGAQAIADEFRRDPNFPRQDFCDLINDPTVEDLMAIISDLLPTLLAPPFAPVVKIVAEALQIACSPEAEKRTNPWPWVLVFVAATLTGAAIWKWFRRQGEA